MRQKTVNGKKLRYLKGKNYRARELAGGGWGLEIRSIEWGDDYKKLPVGTRPKEVHDHARIMLHEMANSSAPTLARKVLKGIILDELITQYLKVTTLPRRERDNITYFQTVEKTLCSVTLDKGHIIEKGIEDHVERRITEVDVPYSVTRQLSPIRAMFTNAGAKRLYGLLDYKIDYTSPFKTIKLPEDTSGEEERGQCLKDFGELKIFEAITKQCPSAIERLKWNTLVTMALVTCLRRGVLLSIKWRDVYFDNKWIKISKEYWGKGKRAPEYVPITEKLNEVLRLYHKNLPDRDKTLDTCLFEAQRARTHRRDAIDKTPDRDNWVEVGFRSIIRKHTELCEFKKDKKGNIVRDWFTFYDLRHTGNSRYKVPPYGLWPHEVGYLMGHIGDESKVAKRYNHSTQDFCNMLREKIDKGDAILAMTLQKPGGDIPLPHEIAFKSFIDKATLEKLREARDSIRQIHGAEYVNKIEEDLKDSEFPTTEKWLEEKAKADEFRHAKEAYKRIYGVYPDDDITMLAWYNSDDNRQVDKDRAHLWLRCRLEISFYNKEKELRQEFGLEGKPPRKIGGK